MDNIEYYYVWFFPRRDDIVLSPDLSLGKKYEYDNISLIGRMSTDNLEVSPILDIENIPNYIDFETLETAKRIMGADYYIFFKEDFPNRLKDRYEIFIE